MKRGTLFILALTLIGSSALAQPLPSGEPRVSSSSPPTVGATASAPPGIAAYGTSSGVHGTQFPNGIPTAAFPYGTASAQATQGFYGTAAVGSRFGTPPVMGHPQAFFGTAPQYNPHPYGMVPR